MTKDPKDWAGNLRKEIEAMKERAEEEGNGDALAALLALEHCRGQRDDYAKSLFSMESIRWNEAEMQEEDRDLVFIMRGEEPFDYHR